MFEKLSEKLEKCLQTLKGQGRITEINVAETLKEVRRALVDADVNYKIAKEFVNTVKEKALGQNVLTALKPKELMLKIVYDELTILMGGETAPINLSGNPTVILMSGLQGSGKTTLSGKLALKLKSEKSRRPLLVACDVYRPAAIDQLKVLGEQIKVPVYTEEGNKNPVEIAKNAISYAKANYLDLVIVDTAGRLAIDEQMMKEIESIKKVINPNETLFVVDSMTGQDAVNTAKTFNDRLDFDGVVLTKLDGDTRGGAALSITSGISFAPASIMTIFSAVPQTVTSIWETARCSRVGLMITSPSIMPMLTPATVCLNGISEMATAMEAPFSAVTSGELS